MKKRLLLTFLALNFYFLSNAQCSVSIVSTDATVCAGENPILSTTSVGPENTLPASNSAGNNHRGNMFDIVATNSLTITSFDAFPQGNTTVEIYYKVGTWNGFANTPSAWTFIGSAPVTYTGGFVPVAVPINVTIPAGQTYAFYVTSNTSSVSLNYTNGTNVGNVYSSDPNITFLEGGGMEYPFTQNTGAVYQPRVWNGNIHYGLADAAAGLVWGGGETTFTLMPTVNSTTQFTVEAIIPGCASPAHDTMEIAVSIPPVSAGTDLGICLGDSVMLAGSGAETYSWDNSVTDSVNFAPVSSMNYIVTGTDSIGCIGMDTVLVVVTSPTVNAGTDFGVCIGNSTVLSASGADTYVWNNSVTDSVSFAPVSSMNYIVTGTDFNGCTDTDTVFVEIYSLPVVSAGTDQTICFKSLTTLNGSGADIYMWTNGVGNGTPFSPANSASYSVWGVDAHGCMDSDTVMVTVEFVDVTISTVGITLVANQTGGLTYKWIDCTNNQVIPGAISQIFTPTQNGQYAVIVSNGTCSDTSNCTNVVSLGIVENDFSQAISIFPNPNNGTFTISAVENSELEITDINGRVIKHMMLTKAETEIELSNEKNGVYFVKFTKDGASAVKRVVIQ
jgi:hypothetical protein